MKWFKRTERRSNSFLDAFRSTIGLTVTPENSLETTTVWSAVRVISSTIATLPFPVYEQTDAGKEKAREHPVYRLLHDRPNPEMSSFVWRETLMGHVLLYGNACCEIERNNRGDAIALWPIHPTNIRIERIDNQRVYIVRVNGQDVALPADDVLHFPGFSLDGCNGLIPTRLASNAIGLAKATEKFGSQFFSNGASPSGVLEHPGKLGEEGLERLRKSWNAAQSGLTNAQRVAILEQGMKWTPLGIPPEHAQFLETRKFQVTEIARIFLLPPHLIGDLERATFSNIEHQAIQYVTLCIEPWARKIEQEVNYKLLGDGYFAEFILEGLLRGDSTTRADFYAKLFGIGVLSVNDIREKENLNRVAGGDQRFVPLNMTTLSSPAVLSDAVRSLVDVEVGRFARRKAKRGTVDEQFLADQKAILTENLGPVLTAYFQLTGQKENPSDYIDRILHAA